MTVDPAPPGAGDTGQHLGVTRDDAGKFMTSATPMAAFVKERGQ